MGGLDAHKEDAHAFVRLCIERGLAVVAYDGPGQGEAVARGLLFEPNAHKAVSAVIDHIESHSEFDGGSVGAVGRSLGGYLAPRAAADDKRLSALAVWGAMYDLEVLRSFPNHTQAGFMYITGSSDLDEAADHLKFVDMSDHGERITCPTLVVHGELDVLTPPDHARRLAADLGERCDLKLVPGSGHCNHDQAHLLRPHDGRLALGTTPATEWLDNDAISVSFVMQGSPSLEPDKGLLRIRVRPGPVSTQVANFLRDEIRMGYIEPGTRLRQEEVADRLGVSTTPVREAFRLLQVEGLLTLDPGRGVQVAQPTAEDVLEYYEIRKTLERLAIAGVIERASDEELDGLEPLLARMESIDDEVEWTDINRQFHAMLYGLSHRPHLCSLISNLTWATAGYINMMVQRTRALDQARYEHRAILEAVRSREISLAQDAICHHLDHTVEEILRFLETIDSHAAS